MKLILQDQVFSPAHISGLQLWLDARDQATISKDGSNRLLTWTDKSGNARNFNGNGTDSRKPTNATFGQIDLSSAAAQSMARSLGMRPEIRGILWWQGESDSQNGTWAAAYEANLTALIADMRSFFSNPSLPFLAVVLDNDDGVAYPHMATVNTAIADVIAATDNAYLIDETPFTWTDTIHASTASCEAVGAAAATQFLAID